ncbi:hypothetical protein Ancab_007971 [Ancistrocladus abbreviatus]
MTSNINLGHDINVQEEIPGESIFKHMVWHGRDRDRKSQMNVSSSESSLFRMEESPQKAIGVVEIQEPGSPATVRACSPKLINDKEACEDQYSMTKVETDEIGVEKVEKQGGGEDVSMTCSNNNEQEKRETAIVSQLKNKTEISRDGFGLRSFWVSLKDGIWREQEQPSGY